MDWEGSILLPLHNSRCSLVPDDSMQLFVLLKQIHLITISVNNNNARKLQTLERHREVNTGFHKYMNVGKQLICSKNLGLIMDSL